VFTQPDTQNHPSTNVLWRQISHRYDLGRNHDLCLAFRTLWKGLQTSGRYATDVAATPSRRIA
jgi:hypothetical protein